MVKLISAHTFVTIAALLVACATAQPQCLPGQQKCVSTCCNTGDNFTCCPYNGGYCAPPGKLCCKFAPGGLCSADDTCCRGGCANSTSQCCGESICDNCCNEQCLSGSQKCCTDSVLSGGYDYAVPGDHSCCSVSSALPVTPYDDTIWKYQGVQSSCPVGTVCCPKPNGLYDDVRSVVATGLSMNPCANPKKQFCCGGGACNTEDLCCSSNERNGFTFGQGCCTGVPSKSNSCRTQTLRNNRYQGYSYMRVCPGRAGLEFLKSNAVLKKLKKLHPDHDTALKLQAKMVAQHTAESQK